MMELQDIKFSHTTNTSSYFPLYSLEHSFLSSLFFTWVKPILAWKDKSNIKIEDTYPLPDEEYSERETLSDLLKKHKLARALFTAHLGLIFKTIFLRLIISSFEFAGPIFIQLLIAYILSNDKSLSYGLFLALFFSIIVLSTRILVVKYTWLCKILEIRVKNSICSVVYQKVLKVSSVPEGLGVNLLQIDTKKIFECLPHLSVLIVSPLQMALSIYLIQKQVGEAVYAALITLIICVLLNYIIASKLKKYSASIMTIRDKRIEMSTQLLSNIKMIKAYCWEKYFQGQIRGIRNKELSFLRFLMFLYATAYFFYWTIPSLTTGSVFVYYTEIMGKTLTSEEAFVTLITLTILQDSLQDVPYLIAELLMCFVSIKRMQKLLDVPDLEDLPIGNTITMKNCSFSYGEANVLNNMNLEINKGEFLAVIGAVGSGKSSFLNSLMGEMKINAGEITVSDNIAFVPSLDSWLQNDSLKNNILFGKTYIEKWYKSVIEACSLVQDINSLPDKDLTEIGGKGINLSGGQKARICLARAVYADKEVYLLDDPLSSVDSDVAESIMNKCFLGLLSSKTRILITHRLDILNKVDRIAMLENGTVKQIVTTEKLQFTESFVNRSEVSLEEISNSQNRLIAEEKKEIGRVDPKIYKTYFNFSGGYCMLITAFIAMSLWASTKMIADIVLKNWTTESLDASKYLYWYLLLRVGGSLFVYVRSLSMLVFLGIRASKKIHEKMIISFIKAPVNLFYDVTPLGRLLNRLSKDMNIIDEAIARNIGSLIAEICSAVSKLVLIIIYFPITIPLMAPLIYFSNKVKNEFLGIAIELTRLEANSRSPILNHFGETITGAKIIRTFKQKENFLAKNYKLLNQNSRVQYSLGACKCWMTVSLGILSSLVTCIVAVLIVVWDDISPGVIGITLTYIFSLSEGVTYFIGMLADTENSAISVERAAQYINIAKESSFQTDIKLQNWPNNPSIEFRNVEMRYRPNSPIVLKDLSFSISGGQKIGLIGRTGSGKSSIFLCLLRLVEISSGSIFIDGINIAQISLQKLRSALTLVPQDPLVFSGTLKDNLDPTHAKTDAEISQALDNVGLSRFLIDFQVKNDGLNLSVGERQLISLGRAMLSHTKIILFDEATAGIDHETDSQIQRLIQTKFFGCTVLMIAHRIGTIMNSNLIIVMHDGKCKEIDTPQSLQTRNSLFKDMKLKNQQHK
ncbi:unnamed protein product [Blepharisma stoltei]|uniref:Uncharacterized protein n=1 Tax=Blepharisma stoltei TaxID=1481888 RepID=A0AAU9JYH8_9CILI|nr:unnamed protein product [Blepharisma stoltei]